MNRKKKINQTLKAKAKKANSKLSGSNKPKYIAKADREALAQSQAEQHILASGCSSATNSDVTAAPSNEEATTQ